jgi:hypothetical protein
MMQIVYTVCALAEPDVCETRVLRFTPRLPIACIHAAGPELAAGMSEHEKLVSWSCATDRPPVHEEDE